MLHFLHKDKNRTPGAIVPVRRPALVPVRSQWQLPGITDRVAICGKTGCGKTTAALFILAATQWFKKIPVIVIDYKDDEHIAAVPMKLLRAGANPPTEPGLYKLIAPDMQARRNDTVETFLQKVLDNGHTGLLFDEAHMLPDCSGRSDDGVLRPLFATGRSRIIPIISLTQRPVRVTRWNFSEASHHAIFRLNDKRDRDTVRGWVPNEEFDEAFGQGGTEMPKFHSLWYDVDRDLSFQMLPFPSPDEVIARLTRDAKNNWR
jgi:hypothetical protein